MHAAANSPRGGGVSPRSTRLRGQGLIEYVLLIAVISLTVAFAGPPVAGAIGNQFSAIAGAVGGSITGGAIGGIGGGIGGGTSGGTHTGGTAGGNHGTSGGTSGGGTTVKPGSGSTGGGTGTTGGGSSSGTVNPGSGSTGSQTTKPGQSGTNPGGGNTGSTGSGTGSTTVKPGSGSTGNTGTTGGGSSSGTTKPGTGSTGNTGSTGGNTGSTGGGTSTRLSQPVPNPTDGLEKKDPKDWMLIDQKVVAEDISKNGTGSKYYPAAKKAMDEGTKWKTPLLNGQTLEYRIIGINHDNLANGSGKAGLTFMTTSTGIKSRMNATNTNSTGWKNSELRAKMNFGEIWNLLPADLQKTIKPVTKLTVDRELTASTTPTSTSDKLFLLSIVEIAPSAPSNWHDGDWDKPSCLWQEGTQYEAFQGKVLNNTKGNAAIASNTFWWERTNLSYDESSFLYVSDTGDPSDHTLTSSICTVFPVFCF